MEILMVLIVGGLAGWLASIIVNRNEQMGIVWNIVVGIIGAAIANWLLSPIFGFTVNLAAFSFSSFFLAVLGAIVLLAIVNLFTRKRIR
jgi:uncharacterized membrane protein YeaQ/YmgE (transglycosylase-associated protein family)